MAGAETALERPITPDETPEAARSEEFGRLAQSSPSAPKIATVRSRRAAPGRPAPSSAAFRRTLAGRLATARYPLMAAGLVAVLAIAVGTAPLAVVAGFALVVAAAAFGPRRSRAQRLHERAESRRSERRAPYPEAAALIDALPDPAFLLDPLLAIVHQNAAADLAFGPSPERFAVRLKFRAPELRDLIERSLRSRGGETVKAYRSANLDRWFDVRAVPLRRADSRSVPYTLLLFREQTEARREAKLRRDFIANASHELRTPLASLIGFIETLQGPARDDPAARERFLGIMATQARRMTRLVNDLMGLSALERRAHVAPSEPVDLGALAGQVVDAARPLADESGVALSATVEPELPPVAGDRDELTQVVENLVENALRYGADGGRVEVTVHRRDGSVEVAVRDHGAGIAPEHLPRLTERFYRVDAARSRSRMGTGLGLAIVKHILARHGSRLVVESEVGEGACFSFALLQPPREAEDSQEKSTN